MDNRLMFSPMMINKIALSVDTIIELLKSLPTSLVSTKQNSIKVLKVFVQSSW